MATNSLIVDTGRQGKGLHIGLWLAQGILAVLFGIGGVMKMVTPIAELAQKYPWVADVSASLVRFIGVSELAGAIGLILPAATKILPRLTPLAAAGLATIMLLAAGFHISRAEFQALPVTAVLGGAALFVALGRSKRAPVVRRT